MTTRRQTIAVVAAVCPLMALVYVAIADKVSSGTSADRVNERVVGPAPLPLVTLEGTTQRRLGIETAPLVAIYQSATAEGFAKGLEVGPLAAILAEVDAAEAASTASNAEFKRTEALNRMDVSASRRSVEQARAQAVADSARTRLAIQRMGLEIGPGILRFGVSGARGLVSEVAAGRAALVRVDIPGPILNPGARVLVGERPQTTVRLLGPAATADARLQVAGSLAVIRGPMAQQLIAGRVLPATVATSPGRPGLLIPREAVIRFQGQLWVYRRDQRGFGRVALVDPVSVADGWVISRGLNTGDQIAIRGATGLLAIEQRGSGSGTTSPGADED